MSSRLVLEFKMARSDKEAAILGTILLCGCIVNWVTTQRVVETLVLIGIFSVIAWIKDNEEGVISAIFTAVAAAVLQEMLLMSITYR